MLEGNFLVASLRVVGLANAEANEVTECSGLPRCRVGDSQEPLGNNGLLGFACELMAKLCLMLLAVGKGLADTQLAG